ncbi:MULTISPECIES: DUF3263 domain-containing protein [unclassified Streptomyces]|uniref:DUF3263 domain-containing protein n=1 Tax=unclassified Streptomyces TaxID=2593676 RepID=UPI00093C0848|nr:DUF3263 domain-containing protein [Streptomyces sp. CB02058]OKI97413.1 hypothetical protein AMK10_00760 [Streptomyces sp. CB02058]
MTADPSDADDPGRPADDPGRPDASAAPLSEQQRAVLALERRDWAGPGAKERAVREQLGMSPVRYYQLLNALLDDRRALEEDPVTVNRLRRVRDARRGRR